MKWILKNTALALILLAVGATITGAQEPDKIRVAIPSKSAGFAPWYVAEAKGIFKQHNINVQFITVAPPAVPAALMSGNVEFTPLSGTVTQARLAGLDVVNVAVMLTRPLDQLVVRGDISTLADLSGKTILAGPPTSLPTQLINYFMARQGIARDSVKIAQIGASPTRRTMFAAGKADAIMDNTEATLKLLETVSDTAVLIGEDHMPAMLTLGVATPERYLSQHKDVVERVLSALRDANVFALENPGEAGRILAHALDLAGSEDGLAKAYTSAIAPALAPTDELFEADSNFRTIAGAEKMDPTTIKSTWNLEIAKKVDAESRSRCQKGRAGKWPALTANGAAKPRYCEGLVRNEK